jgi:hypothetical protein
MAMSDAEQNGRDPLSTLLTIAGVRERPSAAATDRARAAALEVWRTEVITAVGSRASWWYWMPRAVAAGVVAAAILLSLWMLDRSAPPRIIATVAALEGAVETDSKGAVLAVGSELTAGSTIRTRAGRLAVQLDGISLRLDTGSRLRLDAAEGVTLLEGRVYVDTGADSPGPALRVSMPLGVVEHVGTQYEIAATDGSVQVRVREGQVRVTAPATASTSERVTAGEGVRIDAAGTRERHAIRTFGPDWDWVSAIAPPFAIEGRTLHEYLVWLCREQGWKLRWSDNAEELAARRVVLHGSIDGLDIEESRSVVAAIAQANLSVSDGALSVQLSPARTPEAR